MIAVLFFWVSLSALIYTYILYPVLIGILAGGKSANKIAYGSPDEIPMVSVVMSVYNEEEVLAEKIESIINNRIPGSKLEILVGSDASTDNTVSILEQLALNNKCIRYRIFNERRGKASVINELVSLSGSGIIIITDANVFLQDDTIFKLVRHFKNSNIGLVDTNMRHKGLRDSGISVQENAYITREVKIKYHEGILWGTMMGPFGGCYAVRKELFSEIPPKFLVDDFYVNMKVILSGHKAIIERDAKVYEDVSNSISEEFRRKVRIGTGNFQNLRYFGRHMVHGNWRLSFCFLSHKVLRWLGPFFLAAFFISTVLLMNENLFYKYVFIIQLFILTLPIIDYFLGKLKIHIIILRFVTHFISMNFALLLGYLKFLKGVDSNVWQPTKRNQ